MPFKLLTAFAIVPRLVDDSSVRSLLKSSGPVLLTPPALASSKTLANHAQLKRV
jgi:hypothetical protein